MATVFDVAQYILEKKGTITAMKLQKICYYSQAWSLVWDEKLLFNERIEAWVNGPVVADLYALHRGSYQLSTITQGNSVNLSQSQKDIIDKVISFYGEYNSQQLSDLTHLEDPWILARQGMSNSERGNKEITPASMAEYYSSL